MADDEKICICGDEEDMHIDACEQCIVDGCGCKEFEEASDEDESY